MKRLLMVRVGCVLALVLLALGIGSTAAQDATPAGGAVVLPPNAEVDGLDLGAWSARSWQWFFSLPEEANPLFDQTGERCGYGQSGPVFFLAGTESDVERACAVPAGVHVFVPLLGSACSTVEPPPFFGEDEADLSACSTAALDMAEGAFDMSTMGLTVDGQAVDDLSAYRTTTPLYTLWLPEANLLGVADRAADSVADGYQVMLSPLSEGEHVVEIVLPGPEPVTITYRLTVVSGAYDGTPD